MRAPKEKGVASSLSSITWLLRGVSEAAIRAPPPRPPPRAPHLRLGAFARLDGLWQPALGLELGWILLFRCVVSGCTRASGSRKWAHFPVVARPSAPRSSTYLGSFCKEKMLKPTEVPALATGGVREFASSLSTYAHIYIHI